MLPGPARAIRKALRLIKAANKPNGRGPQEINQVGQFSITTTICPYCHR